MNIPPAVQPDAWRHALNGIAWFAAASPVVTTRFDGRSFDHVSRWVDWFRAHRRAHPFGNSNDEWSYVLAYHSSWRETFEEAVKLSEEAVRATIEVLPEPKEVPEGQECLPVHMAFLLALALKTSAPSAVLWQLVKETFDAHPFSK